MADSLILPSGQPAAGPRIVTAKDGAPTVDGMMTRSQWNQLQAILNSQWCLFRNDGGQLGERAPCRWHQEDPYGLPGPFDKPVTHSYFTYRCIERPFRGLTEGLWAAYRVASEGRRGSIMRVLDALPNFADAHPETARGLVDGQGESVYGVLLALPEPITVERASFLIERINGTNPPVKLPSPYLFQR